MKKCIVIVAVIVTPLLFLTVAGLRVLPKCSLPVAFLAPLGTAGYSQATRLSLSSDASVSEVEALLGSPVARYNAEGNTKGFAIEYLNPHSSENPMIVTFSENGTILDIDSFD